MTQRTGEVTCMSIQIGISVSVAHKCVHSRSIIYSMQNNVQNVVHDWQCIMLELCIFVVVLFYNRMSHSIFIYFWKIISNVFPWFSTDICCARSDWVIMNAHTNFRGKYHALDTHIESHTIVCIQTTDTARTELCIRKCGSWIDNKQKKCTNRSLSAN